MPNRPTHLAVSENFTFAQRESLEFELAMSGTGTLRGVLLAVKPDGDPLAIITSTQTNSLARMTRVDQRLLRIILNWPVWVENQAVLHLLCAPTDEIDCFSRLNALSLAHYSRPTSLHYQPNLPDYIGWRSLHLASWRIVENQPQMKALAQPYDHALPAAAHDFGFTAADVASALVMPNIKTRRSQHANFAMQAKLQENPAPLIAVLPAKNIDLTATKYFENIAPKPDQQLPRPVPEQLTDLPVLSPMPILGHTQADDQLAQNIAGLVQAWQQALPELPPETWDIWQQHWLFNQGQPCNKIATGRDNKNWRQELQQQPWLAALVRQHTAHMFSSPYKEKALSWLDEQI